jgi:hypothetical protein
MGLLHIYDDDDWSMRLMTKRDDAQVVVPVRGGAWKMVEQLDSVVASRQRFDRVLFETHGSPGVIVMGEDGIDARWMRAVLGGRHYESFCEIGTRLYFNGCNVAEGNAGWDFLRAAAEVFLIGRGGIAFGHTSKGFANPLDGHVVHPWGDTRHVVMEPGGDAYNPGRGGAVGHA